MKKTPHTVMGLSAEKPVAMKNGELVEPDPHHHIVVSGEQPKASPRYYLIK